MASGKRDARPDLEAALKALRPGDTLFVWKLDRLGRNLKHLVTTVDKLAERKIGFKVLTGHGASIDTTTPSGKLIFGIFASLAEFERDLIAERTRAGLAAMSHKETRVGDLCKELGVSRQTLYRHVGPDGSLRQSGSRLLAKNQKQKTQI